MNVRRMCCHEIRTLPSSDLEKRGVLVSRLHLTIRTYAAEIGPELALMRSAITVVSTKQ